MPIIGGRGAGVRGLGFQGAGRPSQVTGLTATNVGSGRAFNNGRIDLAWSAPATNGAPITGYLIEQSTNSGSTWSTLVANTGTTSVSYSHTGLTSAQRYDYRVSAINAVGTGTASTAANATATTVPQAPTIGTTTLSGNTASVAFTPGGTGGLSVTYTATSSPSSITGTNSASPVSVANLARGTAYTFTVTATNANGTSAASAASNSVTPDYNESFDSFYSFTAPTTGGYSRTLMTGNSSSYGNMMVMYYGNSSHGNHWGGNVDYTTAPHDNGNHNGGNYKSTQMSFGREIAAGGVGYANRMLSRKGRRGPMNGNNNMTGQGAGVTYIPGANISGAYNTSQFTFSGINDNGTLQGPDGDKNGFDYVAALYNTNKNSTNANTNGFYFWSENGLKAGTQFTGYGLLEA